MEPSIISPAVRLKMRRPPPLFPMRTALDPALRDSDMYIWATDVYPVYISSEAGGISASFEDMGFQNGWDLVRIDQNEITDVAALSSENNCIDSHLCLAW